MATIQVVLVCLKKDLTIYTKSYTNHADAIEFMTLAHDIQRHDIIAFNRNGNIPVNGDRTSNNANRMLIINYFNNNIRNNF